MIYDTFMFFDELDMLEIRLNTLKGSVNHFVLVESEETHSGGGKPLYFQDNKARFKPHEEILPCVYTPYRVGTDRWAMENAQRESAMDAIASKLFPIRKDWVVVSDVDEIWNPAAWPLNPSGPFVFEMEVRAFWLNGAVYCHAPLAVAAPWSYARKVGLQALRDGRESQGWPVVKNGGWAYSWVGRTTPEEIHKKLGAFAHAELDNEAGFQTWHGNLQGAPVEPLSDKLPPYVLANAEKFKHLIKL